MTDPVTPPPSAATPTTADEPAAPAAAADPAGASSPAANGPGADRVVAAPAPDRRKRPLIERLGLAVIALVLAALFAVVAVASFMGGEPFLGVMGAIGCLMVLWVGGLTLVRG